MRRVMGGKLATDAGQPRVEHFGRPRIEGRETADDAGLASGDDQIRHRDDEHRRADHRHRQAALQDGGQAHGAPSSRGLKEAPFPRLANTSQTGCLPLSQRASALAIGAVPAGRKDRILRYISTRGEAPPLGFIDVTLAGLARDGGLYVPETWPVFAPDRIAGLAGKPYAEAACEVLGPFVGDALAPADLARMAREAYAAFRHPCVAP